MPQIPQMAGEVGDLDLPDAAQGDLDLVALFSLMGNDYLPKVTYLTSLLPIPNPPSPSPPPPPILSHSHPHISHLTSHIPHPTSHIPHLTSHIPHPSSHIPNPTSHIPHPHPLPSPPSSTRYERLLSIACGKHTALSGTWQSRDSHALTARIPTPLIPRTASHP